MSFLFSVVFLALLQVGCSMNQTFELSTNNYPNLEKNDPQAKNQLLMEEIRTLSTEFKNRCELIIEDLKDSKAIEEMQIFSSFIMNCINRYFLLHYLKLGVIDENTANSPESKEVFQKLDVLFVIKPLFADFLKAIRLRSQEQTDDSSIDLKIKYKSHPPYKNDDILSAFIDLLYVYPASLSIDKKCCIKVPVEYQDTFSTVLECLNQFLHTLSNFEDQMAHKYQISPNLRSIVLKSILPVMEYFECSPEQTPVFKQSTCILLDYIMSKYVTTSLSNSNMSQSNLRSNPINRNKLKEDTEGQLPFNIESLKFRIASFLNKSYTTDLYFYAKDLHLHNTSSTDRQDTESNAESIESHGIYRHCNQKDQRHNTNVEFKDGDCIYDSYVPESSILECESLQNNERFDREEHSSTSDVISTQNSHKKTYSVVKLSNREYIDRIKTIILCLLLLSLQDSQDLIKTPENSDFILYSQIENLKNKIETGQQRLLDNNRYYKFIIETPMSTVLAQLSSLRLLVILEEIIFIAQDIIDIVKKAPYFKEANILVAQHSSFISQLDAFKINVSKSAERIDTDDTHRFFHLVSEFYTSFPALFEVLAEKKWKMIMASPF